MEPVCHVGLVSVAAVIFVMDSLYVINNVAEPHKLDNLRQCKSRHTELYSAKVFLLSICVLVVVHIKGGRSLSHRVCTNLSPYAINA